MGSELPVLLDGGTDLLLLLRRAVVRVRRLVVDAAGGATVPRLGLQPEELRTPFAPLHPDETDDARNPVGDVAEDGTVVGVVRPSENRCKRRKSQNG